MFFKFFHFGYTKGKNKTHRTKTKQKRGYFVRGDLHNPIRICIRLHLGAENLVGAIVLP